MIAMGARVLLLDEPTAGVAQRETEAFGPLIKRIQRELGATIVIIEHDIPLVMSMSDRVYCLAAGQCIAEGLPDEVRNDTKVVAAYLGTDERAIQRSGAMHEVAPHAHGSHVDRGQLDAGHAENGNGHVDLHALRRTELVELASAEGVTGCSRMRKDELIAVLESSR